MKRFLFVILVLLVAVPVFAGSPLDLNKPIEKVHVATLSGSLTPNGNLRINIQPGPKSGVGIRVYSEPSHVLLVEMLDYATFGSTGKGQVPSPNWIDHNLEPNATVMTSMPAGNPVVEIPDRPERDDRIAVSVLDDWGNGLEEILVADGAVGRTFSFSVYVNKTSTRAGGGGFEMTHCCSSGGCTTQCVTCTGTAFTCCASTCEAHCGYVTCGG